MALTRLDRRSIVDGMETIPPQPPGYRTQSVDTSYEAEQIVFAAYRRMTPAERVRRACDLAEAGRRIALIALRNRHPEASERELLLRLASWTIDPADLKAATGWPAPEADDALGLDSRA